MKATRCMAAAVMAALMAVCVTFAGCGGSKSGPETKAAEAEVKKEFGVSGEELIVAAAIMSDVKDDEIAEMLAMYAMMGDSEKAATLQLVQSAISAAMDSKEASALMDKAKKKTKGLQKDIAEKQGLKPCYSMNGSTNAGKWGKGGKDFQDYDVEVDETADGWRLPTEAEWLAAADDGHTYSGSDNIDDVAWYHDNSDRHPQKVGTKAANANGLYDMSGNVWEWCWDKDGSYRVLRGDCCYGYAGECAVSARLSLSPDRLKYTVQGFRLVRNAN